MFDSYNQKSNLFFGLFCGGGTGIWGSIRGGGTTVQDSLQIFQVDGLYNVHVYKIN